MNSLSVLGKYLDQPRLVGKFSKAVPAILIAGGGIYTFNHVQKTPDKDKKKELIKTICVLAGTITAAVYSRKVASKIMKSLSRRHVEEHIHEKPHAHGPNCCHEHHHEHVHCDHGHNEHHEHGPIDLEKLKHENTELVDDFLKENKVTQKTQQILNKAKEKVLNISEVKTIFNELGVNGKGKTLLNKLIPNPENIDSKHIFGEIGELSIIGLMPVLGGIAGGIAGDKFTEKNWREKVPNKIKEGSYQYLANIFLCNIGAGAALLAMEKAKVQSKAARALAMVGGIALAGVVFGSAMANIFGKFVIDPLLGHKHNPSHNHHGLYSERKPEALDLGLHIDDVSTVAVLSGLKWIAPALPILYSISGYRAGIGYRNNEGK